MGVTYELIEGPYPYVCALYRCRCGATTVRHGPEAGAPPTGWLEDPATETCTCPRCTANAESVPGER